MAKPENETKPTSQSVKAFIDGIEDEQRRKECRAISKLMRRVTGARPKMWGDSIVGFGDYHYKYDSGREGDFFLAGFSPRKQALSLYIVSGFKGHEDLLDKLGKYKTGKSCLNVKRLSDIDLDVLEELVSKSVEQMSASGPRF